MLATPEKIREYVGTELTNAQLVERMSSIEAALRAYTNNHFLNTNAKANGSVDNGAVKVDAEVFEVGDTVEVNHSLRSDGLYTVLAVAEGAITLDRVPSEKGGFTVCLVQYPRDVVQAGINMLKWSLEYGEKTGIKSETISRWSVSYVDMDSASEGGYPRAIMTALWPYRQAQI